MKGQVVSPEGNRLVLNLQGQAPAWDLDLGDLDGDGNLDLLELSKYQRMLVVYDVLGKRHKKIYKNTDNRPIGLIMEDLNGDGKMDIALLRESGLGPFYTYSDVGLKKIPYHSSSKGRQWVLASGDVNNDGRPDLVSGGEGDITIFINKGDFKFKEIHIDIAQQPGAQPPIIRELNIGPDLNGDGRPEIYFSNYSDLYFGVLFSQGNTGYQPVRVYKAKSETPKSLIPLGKAVVVAVFEHPPRLLGFKFLKPRGTFEEIFSINCYKGASQAYSAISKAISADINNDGLPDLILAKELPFGSKGGQILLYENNGRGGITLKGTIPTRVMSASALAYRNGVLALVDYKSGLIQIFKKGVDF